MAIEMFEEYVIAYEQEDDAIQLCETLDNQKGNRNV